MYVEEQNLLSGEIYDPPKIHWDEEEKYAVIGYLLMSLDKTPDPDKIVRLDDLFGLTEDACADESEAAIEGRKKAKEAVISECGKFLSGLEPCERYDRVAEEIDKFIDNDDRANCAIGGTYQTFHAMGISGKLPGGYYLLWDLVKLVIGDADYSGSKKRLLKHLARKWELDPSVLPLLENAARLLPEIEGKRRELSESDLPHREVVAKLAELDAGEKELRKGLKALGISECREVSKEAADIERTANARLAAQGLKPDFKVDLNEVDAMTEDGECREDDEPEWSDEDERNFKIGQIGLGICEFFEGIADGIDRLAAKL